MGDLPDLDRVVCTASKEWVFHHTLKAASEDCR